MAEDSAALTTRASEEEPLGRGGVSEATTPSRAERAKARRPPSNRTRAEAWRLLRARQVQVRSKRGKGAEARRARRRCDRQQPAGVAWPALTKKGRPCKLCAKYAIGSFCHHHRPNAKQQGEGSGVGVSQPAEQQQQHGEFSSDEVGSAESSAASPERSASVLRAPSVSGAGTGGQQRRPECQRSISDSYTETVVTQQEALNIEDCTKQDWDSNGDDFAVARTEFLQEVEKMRASMEADVHKAEEVWVRTCEAHEQERRRADETTHYYYSCRKWCEVNAIRVLNRYAAMGRERSLRGVWERMKEGLGRIAPNILARAMREAREKKRELMDMKQQCDDWRKAKAEYEATARKIQANHPGVQWKKEKKQLKEQVRDLRVELRHMEECREEFERKYCKRSVARAVEAAARQQEEERERAQEWLRGQSEGEVAPAVGSVGRKATTKDGESAPTWASMASDIEDVRKRKAIWRVRFAGTVPCMEASEEVAQAMLGALQGTANFQVQVINEASDMIRFDYAEPWPHHFVEEQRGDTIEGKEGWRQAWLRREMRGIVIRRTGEVIVRGLHKFFNVGQLKEVELGELVKKDICEVLEKLDGQMIVGVMVGDTVQCWSRKGHTQVGAMAERVMEESTGNYQALIAASVARGRTPVFELIGKQSRIKTDEGPESDLVLIAERHHISGNYSNHSSLWELGQQHGVRVVKRFRELEQLSITEVVDTVRGWEGREGVVVRFNCGTMVKAKSEWWLKTGFCRADREAAKQWHSDERVREANKKDRLHTRGQRIAIWGLRGQITAKDIHAVVPAVVKVEMVYKTEGNLAVVIASVREAAEAQACIQAARVTGWQADQAYSRRTRPKLERRIEVFTFD
jgi:hypothetical protein